MNQNQLRKEQEKKDKQIEELEKEIILLQIKYDHLEEQSNQYQLDLKQYQEDRVDLSFENEELGRLLEEKDQQIELFEERCIK